MLDIIKLQKIIVKAFTDYELSSPRLDKEIIGAFLAVDIYRAETEPVPAPRPNTKKSPEIPREIEALT
ncbi:MAG: hypothetical protein WC810_23220 [Janthinobacterium sp.]